MNDTGKSKTLIRFGLYMLFLAIVIGLIVVSGVSPTDKRKSANDTLQTQKTYLEKEKELFEGTYNYKFNVDDGLVTYTGAYTDGIRTGVKKTETTTIQYEESEEIYKIVDNQKEKYEDLYEGLDAILFDFKSLFDKLNSENCLIERTDEETIYTYTGVLDYDFVITASREHIMIIQIDGEHKYIFEFTY